MKTAKQKKILIEELEKNPVIGFASKKAGVARATYYRWLKRSKKFAEKAAKALEKGVFRINDLGQAQIILMMKDGNLTAIKFWLTYRDPAFSKKFQLMKYSKLDDRKVNDGELTPEEQALIKRAIELDYSPQINKPKRVRIVTINKSLTYSVAS